MKKNALQIILILIVLVSLPLSGYSARKFIQVSGQITDNNKAPLIGCSVLIKHTAMGTMSDTTGHYTINVEKGDTLQYKYLGFNSKEKAINAALIGNGKRVVLDMVLEEKHQELEDVVVVGYAPQKKAELTGCISVVSTKHHKSKRSRHSKKSKKAVIVTSDMSVSSEADVAATMTSSSSYSPQSNKRNSYYDNENSEEYENAPDNAFATPQQKPYSTFSIDVDPASYSTVRRDLNGGRLPSEDEVRTEEMVNYFSYDYPSPKGEDPVSISAEVGQCPWQTQNRLVKIGLKAKEIESSQLPPTNFVFLIDVSGSMDSDDRLGLVKSSLKLLVNNLRDSDRVAIVVYASEVGVKLESTPGSNKQKIIDTIESLNADGSTNGGEGLKIAYKMANKNFIKNGNNRIILCTDGDFNVGESSDDDMVKLIEKERTTGVYLTVLGYGMGNYKDRKMELLADKGNGNHAYIDNLQEANRFLVKEFGATMFTVAKDVKLQVEFNPTQVQAYRLIGYETRMMNDADFNDDTKDAGEMGAGHTVTALYEIVPVGVKCSYAGNVDPLKYQKKENDEGLKATGSKELLTIKLRYKDPKGGNSKKIEVPLTDTKDNEVSTDFKFAASVAMFGQLLRDSKYKGDASYQKVIDMAKSSIGKDANGYRNEFVRLAEIAKGLK